MPDMDGLAAYRDEVWAAVPEGAEPELALERRAFLLEHVAPGARVLDLGCGDGWFGAELAEQGAVVRGFDASAAAVDRARRRGLDAHVWPDGAPLPVEDGWADVAWAGEVLEHVVDVGGWLAEARRALKPGGALLVTTPSHTFAVRLRLAFRGWEEHLSPTADHLRFFTTRSLRRVLADAGFAAVELGSTGGHLLATAR